MKLLVVGFVMALWLGIDWPAMGVWWDQLVTTTHAQVALNQQRERETISDRRYLPSFPCHLHCR